MKKKCPMMALLAFLALGTARTQAQDHGHLNVGAAAQAKGAQLRFDNGGDFVGNYLKTLTFTNAGKFASLFQGNITFTALHSANAFGDPTPGAPAPGAFIVAEIVSVAGPEGASFQFWETNSVTTPAISLPTGSTNAGFRFELSESALGAGEPGGDPFGHIHGRRFTVTKPGLYTVGFRALDVSTNGSAGGSIHTASEILHVVFQGDVNITNVKPEADHTLVTFGAVAGYSWQLQSKETFSDSIWTQVGSPVTGNDSLIEIRDDRPMGRTRVYRLTGSAVAP